MAQPARDSIWGRMTGSGSNPWEETESSAQIRIRTWPDKVVAFFVKYFGSESIDHGSVIRKKPGPDLDPDIICLFSGL